MDTYENVKTEKDQKIQFMSEAISQAEKALLLDEVPIGCVIVQNGRIIAEAHNRREIDQQSIHHAEMIAISQACRLTGSWRLDDCDLYVTLEPCPMCAGAIIQSRIRNVYFGAYDPKGGSCGSVVNLFEISAYNHHPDYEGGILQTECAALLSNFFRKKRNEKKRLKIAEQQALLSAQNEAEDHINKEDEYGLSGSLPKIQTS